MFLNAVLISHKILNVFNYACIVVWVVAGGDSVKCYFFFIDLYFEF